MAEVNDIAVASNDGQLTRQPRMLSHSKVVLKKFDIDLARPVADFEHPYADAYEASSHETGLNDRIALVIKGRHPARQDVITACMGTDFVGTMSMSEATAVAWPDGTHRYALIYRRPPGNAAIPRHVQRREALSEEIVRNGIIRPIFYAIRGFADRALFHGNIRPDNIFLNIHDSAEAVLGECASSIPGINQPIAYETIERSMADADGKGAGSVLDDIYSFGATIAVLLRGHNPLEGRNARTIIEDKIIRGSYSVLTDGLRLSPGLSEFLRATLNDDPKQRWNIDHMSSWIDGNRTTPKQSSSAPKAQRAIEFNGKKYIRPRMLAYDIHENPAEAVILIENGQIVKWLERALGDQERADAVNAAISRASVGGRTSGFEDRLLCFVSMALDPHAPIRFKELKVLPSAVGYSLAHAVIKDQKVQSYGELIRDRYGWIWLSHKENEGYDVKSDLLHAFDQASKMIIRRGIDFGLERCLYELCHSAPCLSPLFTNYYVMTCEALLDAIEAVSEVKKQDRPMDRHIACFICVHDSRDNGGLIVLLEGSNTIKKSLALLTIYQSLQKRNDNPKLPGLCEWLMPDAEIVAQRFHNLNLKQEVIKQIPKMVKTGSLTRVMMVVDNPTEVKKDETDFIQAGKYYYALENEKEFMRKKLLTDRSFGHGQGSQVALAISLLVSAIMIAITLVMNYLG